MNHLHIKKNISDQRSFKSYIENKLCKITLSFDKELIDKNNGSTSLTCVYIKRLSLLCNNRNSEELKLLIIILCGFEKNEIPLRDIKGGLGNFIRETLDEQNVPVIDYSNIYINVNKISREIENINRYGDHTVSNTSDGNHQKDPKYMKVESINVTVKKRNGNTRKRKKVTFFE